MQALLPVKHICSLGTRRVCRQCCWVVRARFSWLMIVLIGIASVHCPILIHSCWKGRIVFRVVDTVEVIRIWHQCWRSTVVLFMPGICMFSAELTATKKLSVNLKVQKLLNNIKKIPGVKATELGRTRFPFSNVC